MRTLRPAAAAVLLTITLAACGSDDATTSDAGEDAPPTPTGEASTAAGDPSGSWVLVDGPSDPIPGWDVTVDIEGDRIGGTAACNGYGGSIDVGDGTITVGELGQTEMGCEPAVQQLEQDFLTSLGAATTYAVSDAALEITTPQGIWRFDRLAPMPTAQLVGTTWLLDGVVDGDSVSNEVGMERAFMELADDGTLRGATNCRELSGSWTESGSEILFTSFAADGDCTDDAARVLDSLIITALGDGFRADIDGDRLVITSQGDLGLTFRSAG